MTETWLIKNVNHIKIMFLQKIIQYYTTYQAVQLFCLKQEKVVANTHKHLPYIDGSHSIDRI